MPRIEVRSTSDSTYYHLTSADPELIGRWLLETFDRIKPLEWCPAQITFRPVWRPDDKQHDGVPDWTTHSVWSSEVFLVGDSGLGALRQLAHALTVFADQEDERRREAESAAMQERFADGHPV